jgi:hypothetical protein
LQGQYRDALCACAEAFEEMLPDDGGRTPSVGRPLPHALSEALRFEHSFYTNPQDPRLGNAPATGWRCTSNVLTIDVLPEDGLWLEVVAGQLDRSN